ncbi:hypothetical protein ACFLUX_02615 [Chloroflexota bacterium]
MSNIRAWLFRGLVVMAIGLLVTSWLLPWWQATIFEIPGNWVKIHPWGLALNLGGYEVHVSEAKMPVWFAPLMWAYLGICIGAVSYSLWLAEKEVKIVRLKLKRSQLLIGGVGLSYIFIVILAVIVAMIRTEEFFDLKFIGSTFIQITQAEESWVDTKLLPGYWLACGVGPLLIILALLRNKIIGRPKLSA